MARKTVLPVDHDVVVAFLGETLPFSELDREARVRLARHCLVDFHPSGTRLFIRGVTEVDSLLLIQKGGVKLFVEDEEGGAGLADYRGDGGSIGALALFRGEPAALDVETVEDTFFIKIGRDAFFDVVKSRPEIARYYLKSFSETFTEKAFCEMRARRSEAGDESTLYLFSRRVSDLTGRREPVSCEFGLSLRDAAKMMIRRNVGSLLIREPSGEVCGVFTDKDLRKAVALGAGMDAPVETFMSTPVATIDGNAVCFDALLKMMTEKIHHLAVTDRGVVVGVVTSHDIMVMQGRSPMSIFREISTRRSIKGLYPLSAKAPKVVRTLVQEGARAGNITRMIAVMNDMIVEKLLELLIREIGPPPVDFCWLLMGSEGRREQTFATDQDNALVYRDCEEDFLERAARVYFEAFTERAIEHLVNCGFPRCPGDIMASNPKWRMSLSAWKKRFAHWIYAPKPQEVLHATIFFDFRGAFGRTGLAEELRNHVMREAAGQDVFLRCLAADCLATRPPLSFFKNFIVEKNGEHKNRLNLKLRGLVPFTDFARVLALKHGIRDTSTLGRLKLLGEGGHLPDDLCREAGEAFEFMLQLRLVHQLEQVEQGPAPDNFIDPASLSALEKRTLKDAFGVVGGMQSFLKTMFRLNVA